MRQRILFLSAAALTLVALALPLWGFRMSAPQYPDEPLHLRVARTGITGDVHEVTTLQQYIGVRFPARMPELVWATRAMLALSALLAGAALAGAGAPGRFARAACAGLLLVFILAAAGAVQARLYLVGHDRDPRAPIKAVGAFTPPLVGPIRVGNFTVWSYPHAGGLALLAAAGCAVAGSVSGRRAGRRAEGETRRRAVA